MSREAWGDPPGDPNGEKAALYVEIADLSESLKKANDQAEHFEREWYLVVDELAGARDQLAEAEAQVARLEADARRYQWLRSDATPPGEDCPAVYMMEARGLLVGDELDAAIDAAMGKEQA